MLIVEAELVGCGEAVAGDKSSFVVDETVFEDMIEQQKRKAFEAAAAMKRQAATESKAGNTPTAMRFYLRALGEMQDVMAYPPTSGDRARNPLMEVDGIYATLQK